MIKFKKILEKASSAPGQSSGAASLLLGLPRTRNASGIEASDNDKAGYEQSADAGGARQFELADDLVDGVLAEMLGTDTAVGPAAPDAEAGESETEVTDVTLSRGPAADAILAGDEGSGYSTSHADTAVPDALLSEAAEAPGTRAEETPGGEAGFDDAGALDAPAGPVGDLGKEAPRDEAGAQEPDDGLDRKFMAEVDRLLTEFGRVEATQGQMTGRAEPAEAEEQDAFAAGPLDEGVGGDERDALAAITNAVEEAEARARSLTESRPRAARGGAPAGEGVESAARPAEDFDASALSDVIGALNRGLENIDAIAQGLAAPAAGGQDSPNTITDEEREALFAENDIAQAAQPVIEREIAGTVEPAAAEADGLLAGALKEVEVDLTPSSVGLDAAPAAAETEVVGTEDLLSAVLADLDRLGPVEKPREKPAAAEPGTPAQAETGAAPGDAGGSELDFSRLLAEVASLPDAPESAPANDVSDVLASAATDSQPAAKAPPAARPAAAQPAPLDAGDAFDDDTPDGVDQSDALLAALGDVAPPDDDTDGGDAEAADEGAESEGDAEKDAPLDDPEGLLANLTATMDATQAGAPSEEDAVREQLLSRSKEVEQSVLDEVFGSEKDSFRNELKSRLASVDEAPRDDAESALALEAARLPATQTSDEPIPPSLFTTLIAPIRATLLWTAFQMNRPFARWINPARREVLTAAAAISIGTSFLGLVTALMLRWLT